MKKPFNPYPLSDGREYKPFQFSPTSLLILEIEAKTGTTHMAVPMPKNTSAGGLLFEAALQKLDSGEIPRDSTILRKIKEMDKQELLLAIHGYFEGELITPVLSPQNIAPTQ
mgnify:CR=1 FL=1|tara:strand:+ start:17 stop:352 length:336 start_codon:yes stop_codon:yes gene_type:complete